MLDDCDEQIRGWARSVLGDNIVVSLGRPGVEQSARGVSVYLLEITPKPVSRGALRPPLQLLLRFLVTTWAEEPAEAHRMLGELALAAMEASDLEVEDAPVAPEVWLAIGTPLRASFVLTTTRLRERPTAPAPRVRELLTEMTPTGLWRGRVVGPGDVVVADARVELPELGRVTRTDASGRFAFAGLPGVGPGVRVRVTAKGEVAELTAEPGAMGEPMVVQLNFDTNGAER